MGLEDPRGSRGRRSGSQGVAQSQGVGYRVPAGQGVSPERSEGVKGWAYFNPGGHYYPLYFDWMAAFSVILNEQCL